MALEYVGKRFHLISAFNFAAFAFTRKLQRQDRSNLAQDDAFQIVKIALAAKQGEVANNLVPDQDGLYNTGQAMLSERLIGQGSGKQQHTNIDRCSLEAHMLISILHNHPFIAAIGKMFADTAHTSPL